MSAYAIFKKKAGFYDDERCTDTFPDQRIRIKDLLYNKDKNANPLMSDCEEDEIRYFHIPSNNMEWVEVRGKSSQAYGSFNLQMNRKLLLGTIMKSAQNTKDSFDDLRSRRNHIWPFALSFGEVNSMGGVMGMSMRDI